MCVCVCVNRARRFQSSIAYGRSHWTNALYKPHASTGRHNCHSYGNMKQYGYGYGGKRVNPANLALDGRKLVDYSSSDDSPPNDIDDSPTSLPRKMLRLHYGPAQGHVEWTPADEHQPSSSLMFPSSTYRVCCNMDWTVSATRKCTRDEFDNLVARRDVDGIVKVHGVSSFARWLVKTGLHRQASWLEVMCDVERKARSVDADTIIMADGTLYDSTYDDVYH